MKTLVLCLYLLTIPGLAVAQSHPPGYYFFYSDGLYYPDYQFRLFNGSGERNCHQACGIVTGSRSDPYYRGYGAHFYRVYNSEGLSVEYYSPD